MTNTIGHLSVCSNAFVNILLLILSFLGHFLPVSVSLETLFTTTTTAPVLLLNPCRDDKLEPWPVRPNAGFKKLPKCFQKLSK